MDHSLPVEKSECPLLAKFWCLAGQLGLTPQLWLYMGLCKLQLSVEKRLAARANRSNPLAAAGTGKRREEWSPVGGARMDLGGGRQTRRRRINLRDSKNPPYYSAHRLSIWHPVALRAHSQGSLLKRKRGDGGRCPTTWHSNRSETAHKQNKPIASADRLPPTALYNA